MLFHKVVIRHKNTKKFNILQKKLGYCCLIQYKILYMTAQELVFCRFFSNFALQLQKGH